MTFLSLDINTWAAVISALSSAGLLLVAMYQLKKIAQQLSYHSSQLELQRKELSDQNEREKKWHTVNACDRYTEDPIIHSVSKSIWERSQGGTDYTGFTKKDHDVVSLLNYLEGIACGVFQELYNEEIVYDHLDVTVNKGYRAFVKGESGKYGSISWTVKASLYSEDEFPYLTKLYRKWFITDIKPSFCDNKENPT